MVGVFAVGQAVGGPVLARLVDRRGQVGCSPPPPRVWRPLGPTGTPHWLGPLRNGRLALLLVALVGSGVAVGAMTLFVVAYADGRPVPGGGGLLLSLNALGAMLGAIGYGAVRWRAEPGRRLALLAVGMAVAYWALVAVPGPAGLVVLLIIAGAFFAPITIVHPAMGAEIITVAFVVVVIGGLGSFWGVVIAALLVGVVRGITIHFVPAAGEASIYILMFVVLLVRPRGLLGERIEKFE